MNVYSRCALIALGAAAHAGCAAHTVPARANTEQATVLVCRGDGAFVNCRRISVDAYLDAMQRVQPRAGSRIRS